MFLGMLMCVSATSITILAGDDENPEIIDTEGDAFENIDVVSVWFWERPDKPEYLYICMKINDLTPFKIQQTFATFWEYTDVQYACGFFIGIFKLDWYRFSAGEYVNRAPGGGPNYNTIEDGMYDIINGIITWEIPKEVIGNPEPGEVLTNTYSNAFQRLGLLGLIGFTRIILDKIILNRFGNNVWDYAPDEGYGLDYIIQY